MRPCPSAAQAGSWFTCLRCAYHRRVRKAARSACCLTALVVAGISPLTGDRMSAAGQVPTAEAARPAATQVVSQAGPAQAEQFVTLTDLQCPPIITDAGARATIQFKANRPLGGYRMVLALTIPEGEQNRVNVLERYYWAAEKPAPAPPGAVGKYTESIVAGGVTMLLLEPPAGDAGTATKSAGGQGVLTLLLEPSTLLSWPSRFSRSTSFVLKGQRTISVRLHRCVDEACNATEPVSNALSAGVEFR
jgi:hypothetical protein